MPRAQSVGLCAAFAVAIVASLSARAVIADVVTLPSGAQYEGSIQRISGVGENPVTTATGGVPNGPVIFIDDELRFIFVPNSPDVMYTASPPKNLERIRIEHRLAGGSKRVGAVGRVIEITPWDDRGRRLFSMEGGTGRINVLQGITEITPTYTRVEGLHALKNPLVWDMRMATSSIPPDILRKVLLQAEAAGDKNVDSRLRVVKLFIQAEMYKEAIGELAQIREDFPDVKDTFKEQETKLVQFMAQQFLKDIALRRDAGQHQHVIARLSNFPDKDVAGETLIKVRDMLQEYDTRKQQYEQVVALYEKHLAELKDEATKAKLKPLLDELKSLNMHTLERMADYLRLADDASLSVDQKLSLAVTGYLLGSGSGVENVAVAASLIEVRKLVVDYLRSDLDAERQEILDKLQVLEGATPANVAKIIAHIPPPIETPATSLEVPDLYEVKTKGIEEQAEFTYYVQLPPEYHPSRRYPCIVTLNGLDRSEFDQIDWWAGPYVKQKSMRVGQAWRRGYIVIAPQWQKPLQAEYEYSFREHAAVLFALRDACKKISIDTDRVFLSGHVQGGDAAWDIALAHPDLWAGTVLFTPTADRYVNHYAANQRLLPMYFVAGEKDAGTTRSGDWLTENATELDRYLSAPRSDCTVVLFRGRGRDGYTDEIHRIFEWMELPSHRRKVAPPKIVVSSMRPWDNFFWWVEVDGFPQSSMVLPHAWPERGARATTTEAEIIAANGRLSVKPSASHVVVWLSPENVDFAKPVLVSIDGKEIRGEIKPSLEVLLEDVRTRGDRQHPFWAKAEWPERNSKRQ